MEKDLKTLMDEMKEKKKVNNRFTFCNFMGVKLARRPGGRGVPREDEGGVQGSAAAETGHAPPTEVRAGRGLQQE